MRRILSSGAARPAPVTPLRRRSRELAAVVGATVVVDQVGKAVAWRESGTATVNPGAALVAPWLDAASMSSLGGALLDMAGVLALTTAAILTVLRCRDRLLWWALALNIGGWTSNLLDRLGLHWLTAPGSRRGTVDWLRGYNLADLAIWTGCALALAWLAREVLRDVGWDPRRRSHRLAAGAAATAVIGLVVAGMTSTDGSTRPGDPSPERTTAVECRDPAFALAPGNALICADDPAAARPAEVTSAVVCPVERDAAIVHATITNPNRDRRSRFGFAASGPFSVADDAAARGTIDAGGTLHVRVFLPRRAHRTLLYLETAVQLWDADGAQWQSGTRRLWSTDLCARSPREVRTARAALLCTPTGEARVTLAPEPLSQGDERLPVALSWSRPMAVTLDADDRQPRGRRLVVDLVDRALTVVRVAPRTVSDVLVVTGRGPGTIQYGTRTARSFSLPVGRCLGTGDPTR